MNSVTSRKSAAAIRWPTLRSKVSYLVARFSRPTVQQTTGLVTLEDAIETMLGREIVDESDPAEDMQELARQIYRQRLREQRIDSRRSGAGGDPSTGDSSTG